MTDWDAVVVGSGPNGLVAANLLTDAGWSVLVLEAQDTPGGAVRSDRDVHPDFVHDTMSSFYPLAAASPVVRGLGLEAHGLAWSHAPAVLGHFDPASQRWATLHRDRELTAAGLEDLHPGDGEAWLELCRTWDVVGDSLVGALLSPFPPVRNGISAALAVRRAGGLDLVRTLLTPASSLARERFGSEAARLLIAGNASHADIPLDAPGSGLMAVLLAMLGQTVGWPVPQGGAGRLAEALVRRLQSRGGTLRCSAEVVGVEVDRGRHEACGSRTASGSGPGPCSPTWRRRGSTAAWCAPRTCRPARCAGCRTSSWTPRRSRSTGPSPGRCRGRSPRRRPRARCTSPTPWRS
ncbi:phytoene desaturase family protein [Nocardioides sp. dk884]|uniref:phytoene desaturase family protein n=1 Tax=Nocardioides sp. dk884 TaxID=2662361 RepID=UPI001E2B0DE4|nr:NAD(P)/FAD-dependent oxidoreductase [Nocardioides sp. dk884]